MMAELVKYEKYECIIEIFENTNVGWGHLGRTKEGGTSVVYPGCGGGGGNRGN